jgi:tetratricopeptide (TPR) repeat protein
VGSILQNLGNLETATGNLPESIENFEKAQLITANSQSYDTLAKIYLGMARIHYLQNRYDIATQVVIQAEMLVVRHIGADKGFMVQ